MVIWGQKPIFENKSQGSNNADTVCIPWTNFPIFFRFVLGDGLNYEGFINRKLKPDTFYKVFVRAYVDVPQKHLYTSSPFSPELNLNMMQEPSGPVPGRPIPGIFFTNY